MPVLNPATADAPRPAARMPSAPHLTEAQRLRTDLATHADKLAGGPDRRNFEAAMQLQADRARVWP